MQIKLNKFFIFSFFILTILIFSQETFAKSGDFFVVTGRLSTDDGNNEDIQVKIIKNGVDEQVFTPPKSGRFRFEFEYNNQFDVTFFKDGYYKKTIVVSTHVPQEVLEENSDFPPFQIEVSLVKEIPGVDKSFTNKPAGRVFYNANIDNFDSEVFFSDIQLEEQAENARSQEQELTEEQRAALTQREADYKQSIASADALMQSRKYEESLEKFQYAKGLFPERPYPRDRIAELQDLVNALKIAEKRRREADKEYYDKIEQADELMTQESFTRAKNSYNEALALKPEDAYSLGQIAKADELIKQRELDLQYNQLISDAENLYSSADFERAKESYRQALLLKSEQSASINAQIQKIDSEIARLADLAMKEQQYKQFMEEGEKALKREKYNEALVAFGHALDNKPDDSMANQRIGEIEDVLLQLETQKKYDEYIGNADQALRDNNLTLAKSLYAEAIVLMPNQDYPTRQIADIDQRLAKQEQFEQLVAQADRFFADQKYEQAKQAFEQALQIEDNALVRERLGEIETQLARIELENKYADLLKRADASKLNNEYELAKTLYNEALALKDDDYPKRQIQEINEELARIEAEKRLEQQFNETLSDAESAYKRADYAAALKGFNDALALNPDDQLVRERISQTEEIILQLEKQQQYVDVITQAKQAFDRDGLEQAKLLYQKALEILPAEILPKEQIALIDQRLAKQEQFEQLVAQADQLFADQRYEQAKQAFEQALQIEDDASVRGKLGETETQLARIELENKYADLLKRADASKSNNEYELAKTLYNEALALKDDNYPKRQIQEIDKELARIEAERLLEQQFSETLANAESAYKREDYAAALDGFNAALALRPDNQLVRERISQTQEMILQLEKQQQYADIMTQAKQAFDKSELEQAKLLYQKALEVLPNETLPEEQIALIDQRIKKEQERLAAIEREKQRNYEAAVQKGDALLSQNEYEPAKAAYQSALAIMPEETYPKNKIAEVEGLIAKLENLTASYNKAIDEANRLAERESYELAKEKYKEALLYLPNEEYPERQIAQIDDILAQIAADKKREADYLAAVKAGDSMLTLESYESAKAKYQEAMLIKPGEAYPKQKITEIDSVLAELKRQQIAAEVTRKAYNEAVQRADQQMVEKEYATAKFSYEEALSLLPEENYPKEQIAEIARLVAEQREQDYQTAIDSGDQFFGSEKYSESKSSYNDALKIKPEDPYASSQIRKITDILEQLAQDNLQREKMEKEYNEKLKNAELLFNNSQFIQAKGLYEQASTIKPEEEYPVSQIAKIDSLLADIQKRKDIDQQYTQLVRQAQNAFNSDELQGALVLYKNAAALKPEEVLPKKRIPEIENLIAQREELARLKAEEEAQNQAMQKAKQEKYDAALANAQGEFEQQLYANAKKFLFEALNIFPDEQYPKDRIAQIDLLIEQQKLAQMEQEQQATQDSIRKAQELAYERAFAEAEQFEQSQEFESAIKSFVEAKEILPVKSPVVNARIEQVQDKMRIRKELDANYSAAIKEADNLFGLENWNGALSRYEEALTYKPDEAYPNERIRIINDKLGDLENRYSEAIREADELYSVETWGEAKTKYGRALALKPKEQYPADQIKQIDRKLAEIKQAKLENAQKEQAYQDAITDADKAFAEDKLIVAKERYEYAKMVKPEETYPANRIAEINDLLAKRAQLAKAEQQQQEIDLRYQKVIVAADKEFALRNHQEAKVYYQGALDIKPAEKYPVEQLRRIEQLLADRELALTVPKVNSVEKVVIQTAPAVFSNATSQYDSFVASADESYNQEDYKVAQYYYQKALNERPGEAYPKERLSEISAKINQSMSKSELAAYNNAINMADEAFAGKQYSIAKFYYYKALGVKSWEQYPKDQIEEIKHLTNSLLSEQKEKEYQDLIAKADEAFIKRDYSVSRGYYNQSLAIKSDEEYPKIRLNEISDLVKKELANADTEEYQQAISKGDEAMASGDFSVARFYYLKAIGLKPNENYPKDQLKVIKKNLSSSDAN